jgi:hypothetical protein
MGSTRALAMSWVISLAAAAVAPALAAPQYNIVAFGPLSGDTTSSGQGQ